MIHIPRQSDIYAIFYFKTFESGAFLFLKKTMLKIYCAKISYMYAKSELSNV